MGYGKDRDVDPLTAALARLPIETSGRGDLDWYVNDLILDARRRVDATEERRKTVRVRKLRTA